MIIAITGGTGFVGRELGRQAQAGGYDVRIVPRGALFNPELLVDTLAGAHCVIHLVGIIVEQGRNTFTQAHVATTRNVIAATAQAGIRRYLHMSALGTRPDARSRYHQTKWAAEELVRHSPLAWTIFRPSVIYGREDKSINVLAQVVRRAPVVPVLGSGQSQLQPVAVDIVAQAFLAALRNDATIGQTYDLCGPTVLSWDALYDQLLELTGQRKTKLHLPLPVARWVATVLESLPVTPPFTRDQLLMLQENNTGDSRPAERDLLLDREPLAVGLARSVSR